MTPDPDASAPAEWSAERWREHLARRERATLHIPEYRQAAVLVPLTARDDDAHLILTVRTRDLPSHQGQIAFPGGKIEPGEDAVTAALREAHEEIGLAPELVRVLGLLDDVWTPQGFHVTPVLAVVPAAATLTPSAREVAEVLVVPVRELRAITPRRETRPLPPGFTVPAGVKRGAVTHYDWRGYDIWGMTAHIIDNFLALNILELNS